MAQLLQSVVALTCSGQINVWDFGTVGVWIQGVAA